MKICYVALNSYNLFAGRTDMTHIGGAEMQQYRMATWLRTQNVAVSVVTLAHGQPEFVNEAGIRVIPSFDESAGYPVVRFFHPRWTGLNRALERADADIYFQRGAGVQTGQVALWARANGRRFMFSTASDADCMTALPFLPKWRDRTMYRAGLRLAHCVITQTESQRRLMLSSYGVSSTVIPSSGEDTAPGTGPADALSPDLHAGGSAPCRALWIGRISPQKRFEWLLELAERLPEVEFLVLGNANREDPYAARMLRAAGGAANIRLIGYVAPHEMADYYRCARFVVCTSPTEGFPNTFLEAWRAGVPVVTSFDPDGVVSRHDLGWHCANVADMASVLKEEAMRDSTGRAALSARLRRYYADHHTFQANGPLILEAMRTCIADQPPMSSATD